MADRVDLISVGAVPPGLLDSLAASLSAALPLRCLPSCRNVDPAEAYTASRGQYDGHLILPQLEKLAQANESLVLGVTEVDLFSSVFTFVFGVARFRGVAAVISLHRLRASFYGLQENTKLLVSRAQREAVHEVGHLLGYTHCRNRNCVMSFSAAAEEIDLKSDRLCALCQNGHNDE